MYYTSLLISFFALSLVHVSFANITEFDDCIISFFEDASHKALVIKQMKDPSSDEQFLLVIDTTACYIAEKSHVPMNKVKLLAADKSSPEKITSGFPATIHTLAPGIRTDKENPYQDIDIHQRFRKKDSPMEKKWGVLPPKNTGLTLTVIQEMAKHPDLPKIVALDTFLGNADRSPPNLFYDASTDQFCGIDMAASFNSELAKEACRQIETLMNTNILLSDKEKEALVQYAKTLKTLIANYPPQAQEELLRKFSQEAGFAKADQKIAERIEYHKRHMQCNYEYSKQLLALVERLIFY